jgi:hypothetical protein
VVVVSSGALPPARAAAFAEPAKRDSLSLATAITIKADNALEKARTMLPGGEREAAIRKAMILANAADILTALNGTVGRPAK